MRLISIDVSQRCHCRFTNVCDRDLLFVPVDADIDDCRREPFINGRTPKGRYWALFSAFEDRLDFSLLIGTRCRIDEEPGLAATFMKVTWPISNQCEFSPGEIHAVGISFFAVPSQESGTSALIRFGISGQPTRAKGLAATDFEAAS